MQFLSPERMGGAPSDLQSSQHEHRQIDGHTRTQANTHTETARHKDWQIDVETGRHRDR